MTDFMLPPAEAVYAPTGPTWLSNDGIIITINNSATHTVEEAIDNMKVVKTLVKGIPRPMLIDITRVRNMSKDVRAEYVKPETKELVTAVALITSSNVGRMVGNLFIGMNVHIVPIKLFNDPVKARDWLMQYR